MGAQGAKHRLGIRSSVDFKECESLLLFEKQYARHAAR